MQAANSLGVGGRCDGSLDSALGASGYVALSFPWLQRQTSVQSPLYGTGGSALVFKQAGLLPGQGEILNTALRRQ